LTQSIVQSFANGQTQSYEAPSTWQPALLYKLFMIRAQAGQEPTEEPHDRTVHGTGAN
jgi:hypothetical protein